MTFDIAEESAVALASVCRRLDGIALAIELAAPSGRMMSLQQSSKRIDDLRRADRRIAHATSLERSTIDAASRSAFD